MFKNVEESIARRSEQLAKEQEAHQAAAVACASAFTEAVVTHLNAEVLKIYETQRAIEAESQGVREEVRRLRANASRVAALVRSVTDSLKQVGDLGNYLDVLEGEVTEVTDRVAALADARSQQQQHRQ